MDTNDIVYDEEAVTVADDATSLDATAAGMHEIISKCGNKVVGFDTETEVEKNPITGRITGIKKKVGLLQFCYRDSQNEKQVLLLRICKSATIPNRYLQIWAQNF